MKQPNCKNCIERHLRCHTYCKSYIDFVAASKKDKPARDEHIGYLGDRKRKRMRRELNRR